MPLVSLVLFAVIAIVIVCTTHPPSPGGLDKEPLLALGGSAGWELHQLWRPGSSMRASTTVARTLTNAAGVGAFVIGLGRIEKCVCGRLTTHGQRQQQQQQQQQQQKY